ncbi:MAG: radical SAM protein [Syntrophobacterales bacterium]|nr:radical SAM protein [Syntrophobacterales bacterium]
MGSKGWQEFLGSATRNIPKKGRSYYSKNFLRAFRSWLIPYIKAQLTPDNAFRPVLAYLYTDLECNMICRYCYSRGKHIAGMTFETAIKAVDWLDSVGCRVLAYMGGEPLIRKDFILELTRYATERGFFVYLPTNGVLLDEEFINAIGRAGVAAINLAVDVVEPKDGLPKAFSRIKDQLEYLVAKEPEYGYITFLNINITRHNTEDAKELTEIAHRLGIATDYHINEPPPIPYEGFSYHSDGWWITPNEFEAVDKLVDWLIEKNKAGYTMVNSIEHLAAMKDFIRGRLKPWKCRAGEITMVIRLDGTFSPCFEMYGAKEDWGSLFEGPRFDRKALDEMKKKCSPHCLSTCNFQAYHYTKSYLYTLQWVIKHAYSDFLGVS